MFSMSFMLMLMCAPSCSASLSSFCWNLYTSVSTLGAALAVSAAHSRSVVAEVLKMRESCGKAAGLPMAIPASSEVLQ